MIELAVLVTTALVVLGVAIALLVALPPVVRRKVCVGLGLLIVLLVAWDFLNYQIIHARKRSVRSELTPGMTVSEATSWLEQHKTRLHVFQWRYAENGDPTFFIILDAPFSVIALLREYESAWYLMAGVDPVTKQLKELK